MKQVLTVPEAIQRFQPGKRLPRKGANLLNTLVAVPTEVLDSESLDPTTCRPLAYVTYSLVVLSLEPESNTGGLVYKQPGVDSRKYDLRGAYLGRRSILPVDAFNSGLKTVFYSYSGDSCDPVWTTFQGDLQSMGTSSLTMGNRLSLPVGVNGEIHFRPIDLISHLQKLQPSLEVVG
jgi:hypothetical protein